MFSHPPAERPAPPGTGPAAAAPGEPALDPRWRAATAGWRPASARTADADRVWAWVRHAWEGVVVPGPEGGADDGDAGSAAPDPRVHDVLAVAALLVLQDRFRAVATGQPGADGIPDPRREGAPLEDDEVLAVVRRTWEIDPAGEEAEGFAAELAGFLEDLLDELAEDLRERLLARRGPTRVFAELWSLNHADELEPAADGAAPFPLSTDDIAWIVSGVPGPGKHTAWEWLGR